jgi:hypothetical protein
MNFQMPEDLIGSQGVFSEVPQITDEHKAEILSGNYARVHGLDIDALRAGIADDEFAQKKRELGGTFPKPWSTTRAHEFAPEAVAAD